jgi:hypothetical protein
MGTQQQCPGSGGIAQQAADIGLLERIEAAGRLVDDQQRRIEQERLRQRDPLLEALREVAHESAADIE